MADWFTKQYRKEKFYLGAKANEKLHDGEPARVIDVFAATETWTDACYLHFRSHGPVPCNDLKNKRPKRRQNLVFILGKLRWINKIVSNKIKSTSDVEQTKKI